MGIDSNFNWPAVTEKTLAIIMGGGAGSRLFPLTKERSKPAVPLAGKYRLVDIPISNCLNSGLRRIYVLTQFNSVSLHRHIHTTYKFDQFSRSYVEILAAQQTPTDSQWYQGTADAVRQNLADFLNGPFEYFVVLSGDQLYRMDYRRMLEQHIETKAELTVGTIPVVRQDASSFGIMHTDAQRNITRFVEKPKDPAVLDTLRIPPGLLTELGRDAEAELFQASMGIYIFNREALRQSLDNQLMDFGKHVIPDALAKLRVQAHIFQGYWEDIGTIRAFFDANLALTNPLPPFSFFDATAPIYTHMRFLPGSKVNGATVRQAIISDGCIISDANIERAVIGLRSIIKSGSTIKNSIVMGADYYEELNPGREGEPPLGIGSNCVVDHAIVDKNARIGNGVVITPDGKGDECDGPPVRWSDGTEKPLWYVRDGIVVIPKGAVLPDGMWV
jgi:glucose-1-phosphate adenylyltransferase